MVRTKRGARQGCKIGALIFNVIYEFALNRVRVAARDQGILFEVPGDAPCPWTLLEGAKLPDQCSPGPAELCDIEFIGDVLFMLQHPQPATRVDETRTMLQIVINEFCRCGLQLYVA